MSIQCDPGFVTPFGLQTDNGDGYMNGAGLGPSRYFSKPFDLWENNNVSENYFATDGRGYGNGTGCGGIMDGIV